MKITAYIKEKSAKNNTTDRAIIFFRVRDLRSKTDIKTASELTINPNHWSMERQGYKGKVMTVSDEERMELDRSIMEIKSLISKEFYIGATGKWLQKLIFAYHHPNAYKITNGEIVDTSFKTWVDRYIQARNFGKHQECNVRGMVDKVERFETFKRKVQKQDDYSFSIGVIKKRDLEEFRDYMLKEHEYLLKYPRLFRGASPMLRKALEHPRGTNTVVNILNMVRSIVRFALQNGVDGKNPFDGFEMPSLIYGTPFYLTIEERDRLYDMDLSDNPTLETYRDMFVFQCLVGCRFGDLVSFTTDNIIDGVLEYVPEKTRNRTGASVRVPLGEKAMAIIRRQDLRDGERLFKNRFNFKFNDAIREILTRAGITRIVTVINPSTRMEEKKPLNEIASSHMARRTFIGNLYKKVKDPNLIASMSGHAQGSKAFVRYRAIDDDMKKELIDMIQ